MFVSERAVVSERMIFRILVNTIVSVSVFLIIFSVER